MYFTSQEANDKDQGFSGALSKVFSMPNATVEDKIKAQVTDTDVHRAVFTEARRKESILNE
jgi:hypothetical protein